MKRLIPLLALLTLSFCASLSSAQELQFKPSTSEQLFAVAITQSPAPEKLADGSLVLKVDGVEYRALTADMVRDLLKAKAEAERTARERDLLLDQISNLKDVIRLTEEKSAAEGRQIALLAEERDNYKNLYEQADRLARTSRVKSFFDRPLVQIVTRGVLPLAAVVISAAK